MKQIDEEAYKAGGAAFVKGKTLHSLFELVLEELNKPYQERAEKENFHNSYFLGFADALLNKLRNIR